MNKKMKFKKMTLMIRVVFLVALFIMLPLISLAQKQKDISLDETTVRTNQEAASNNEDAVVQNEGDITILANVSIWNAKVSNQDGNKLTIDFDINNGVGRTQVNIRYAIQLFDINGKSERLVLEKVFPEIVNIPESTTIHKTIEYVAPDYLQGSFDVDIISESSGGLPLGGTTAGHIILEGSGKYIDIQNENCFLTFKDGSDKDKHTLQEGIVVTKDNKDAFISCDIKNTFEKTEKVIPYIAVYDKNNFGKKIKEEKRDATTLTAGETKTVNLRLPKMDKPQFYSMTLSFKKDSSEASDNNSGKTISTEALFIYILSGESASIQNIRLSKDYYQKGENAVVVLNWLGDIGSLANIANSSDPADTNNVIAEKSPIIAEVSIKSAVNNKKCSEVVKKELLEETQLRNVDIVIPMINDCLNPSGTVRLIAENGTVLDQQGFQIKSGPAFQLKNSSKNDNEEKNITLKKIIEVGLIILGIIIMVGLIIIVFRKNKKIGGLMSMLLFLLAANFVFSAKSVEAVTVSSRPMNGLGSVTVTAQMNKGTYSPGENATLTASCSAHVPFYSSWHCSGIFNGHNKIGGASNVTIGGAVENSSGNYSAYATMAGRATIFVGGSSGWYKLNAKIPYRVRGGGSGGGGGGGGGGNTGTPATCTGSLGSGSHICPGSNTGLTVNTNWHRTNKSSCSTAGKCAYYYQCTGGNPPQGANWCFNDNIGLTSDLPWVQVPVCTGTRKCEYTMAIGCGPADETGDPGKNGFTSTAEVQNAGLCPAGATVLNWHDNSPDPTNNAGWTWQCFKSGYVTSHCMAKKVGECTTSVAVPPGGFTTVDQACQHGSFNSVHLVNGVLRWTCGSDDNTSTITYHLGSFDTISATAGSEVSHDGVPPTTSCQCTPEYTYTCLDTQVDCTNKCGQTINQIVIPHKQDTKCFPNAYLSVTEAEHNCPDKRIKCPPCGINDGESGTINETN